MKDNSMALKIWKKVLHEGTPFILSFLSLAFREGTLSEECKKFIQLAEISPDEKRWCTALANLFIMGKDADRDPSFKEALISGEVSGSTFSLSD